MHERNIGEVSPVQADALAAARLGFTTIEHTASQAEPASSQHAVYGFEGLASAFTRRDGAVDVRAMSAHLAGGEPVPESDIQLLSDQVRQLARPPKQGKPSLDEMIYRELGPPQQYLPRDKRARQKALRQRAKARRKK